MTFSASQPSSTTFCAQIPAQPGLTLRDLLNTALQFVMLLLLQIAATCLGTYLGTPPMTATPISVM
jgi:hypothetical protein